MLRLDGPPLILPAIISAVIYGALALWAQYSPLPAVLIGLVLYIAGIVLGVAQPLDGILLEGIVLVLFVNGIGAARNYEQAKQRLAREGAKG